MTGANYLNSATRRTVLAGLAATFGTGSAAATERATDATRRDAYTGPTLIDVDADNLVAGNHRFTITIEGIRGDNVETATVTIGGISFAAVEVLERDPAVLAVDASNLIANESIAGQDTVEVTVLVDAGDEEFVGTEEAQVIAG